MSRPQVRLTADLATTLAFRLVVACILLLTIAVLLAHGYSTGITPLHALLLPSEDCDSPCFLGIRPGSTSFMTALEQLRRHPWMRSIDPIPAPPAVPQALDMFHVELTLPRGSELVTQLQLVTRAGSSTLEGVLLINPDISLGEVMQVLGEPGAVFLDTGRHRGLLTFVEFYPQFQLFIQTISSTCLPAQSTFWTSHQPLVIGILSAQRYAEQQSYYRDDLALNTGWMQALYKLRSPPCV